MLLVGFVLSVRVLDDATAYAERRIGSFYILGIVAGFIAIFVKLFSGGENHFPLQHVMGGLRFARSSVFGGMALELSLYGGFGAWAREAKAAKEVLNIIFWSEEA